MKRIFLGFLFIFLCFGILPAYAQDPTAMDMKPVPVYEMPQAEFEAKTKAIQDKPNGDNFLAYSMRIPADWQQITTLSGGKGAEETDPTTRLLGEIARFYGPSLLDARSYFVLQSSDLVRDITARNWLMNYILQNGHTLQYLTEISDRKVEAMYFQIEKDTAYLVRAIAQMNGPRLVLAMYYVPESRFQEEKAIQAQALKSFRFLNPQEAWVEPRMTYSFLNLLRFDYPESWRLLAPNIYSIEAMDAKILNSPDEMTLNGEIDIHVVSTELDTTLAQEIKLVQKSIEDRGLVIGKLLEEPQEFKFSDHIYFSRIEVYAANDKDHALIDHEYWIGVLIEDRYFYIVTMLTPSRSIDFYNWATNTEAFKTVVETLRP